MKWWKFISVIVGALVVTALGIDASDTLSGSRFTLLASLVQSQPTSICPIGMVVLNDESRTICVDGYEASTGELCPISDPSSVQDTITNSERAECIPVSKAGVTPWRYVPYRMAEQLCARAGKTLITPKVWYQAALGTVDAEDSCPVSQSLSKSGERATCVSGIGAFDMIGNVWELVAGEVVDGKLGEQMFPATGYVAAVNDRGLPTATADIPNRIYNSDYFWSEATGTFAMMRGGFYGGKTDAGIYSTQAQVGQDFTGSAVGFRCMLIL